MCKESSIISLSVRGLTFQKDDISTHPWLCGAVDGGGQLGWMAGGWSLTGCQATKEGTGQDGQYNGSGEKML